MFAQPDIPQQLPARSPYCWPVGSLDDLRATSLVLRSRVSTELTDADSHAISVAEAIDFYLDNARSGDSGSHTQPDENGKFIVFMQLLAPLARDRSKRLATLDDAANGRPLLVAMLVPDMAFNLSELEIAYDWNIHSELEEHYGDSAGAHFVVHQGSPYIDVGATFVLLSQNHPALLISLAFAVVFPPAAYIREVAEFLRSLSDALLSVELTIAEQIANKSVELSPSDVHAAIVSLFPDAASTIASTISPDDIPPSDEEGSTLWYLRHVVSETFSTLLTEEGMQFDKVARRNEREMVLAPATEDQMEVDGEETPSSEALVHGLHKLERASRHCRHRLAALRRAIPYNEA